MSRVKTANAARTRIVATIAAVSALAALFSSLNARANAIVLSHPESVTPASKTEMPEPLSSARPMLYGV